MTKNTPQLLFPNLTPTSVKALVELAKFLKGSVDPLDHPSCKYPPEAKRAIRAIAKLQEVSPVQTVQTQADPAEDIDISAESKALYQSLKNTLLTVDKMETNEKVQIFRTATALMEKLLSLQEKAAAVESYVQFKNTVMNALDRYLSPVQVSEFISELEAETGQAQVKRK